MRKRKKRRKKGQDGTVQRCEVANVTGLRIAIMTPGNQHIFKISVNYLNK